MTEPLRRVRNAATVAAILALAGCLGGRLPAIEYYRLAPADSTMLTTRLAAPASPGVAPLPALAIAPFEAPGVYGGREIVFRGGDGTYGTYPARRWAVPLPTMLGLLTQDVLRASPLSASAAVYEPPSYSAYPYVWRGRVREMEEVDRGRTVYAAVALEARLVRSRDDSVVWSGTTRLEERVDQGTMPSIVGALSRLASEGLAQLAEEARLSLARTAASAAPR